MNTQKTINEPYTLDSSRLTAFTRKILGLGALIVICSCSSVHRPTDPEYQGAVPIGDNDFVVDMDYSNDEWIMTLTRQISSVNGPGQHTPIYRLVNNVADAVVCTVDDTMFVTSPKEGVLRSNNQGITFFVMPGLDSLGRAKELALHGNELVALRSNGQVLRTMNRRTWQPMQQLPGIQTLGRVGRSTILLSDTGDVFVMDHSFNVRLLEGVAIPPSSRPLLSTDDTTVVILAGKTLYRARETSSGIRVDSTTLPSDREWRAVSVLGENIALLAGRNEVWWGTFDEPLQVQSQAAGDNNKRIVGIALTDIGVVAGFRGTDHSVFLNIKNSNEWSGLFRVSGQPVNDVLWLSRSGGSVAIGTREGGLYTVSANRRALLDVGSPINEMNILTSHGTYPNKLVTMYDGRILQITDSRAEPTLIGTPVPHTNGLHVADAGTEAWFVNDPTTGVHRSNDQGKQWSKVAIPDSIGYLELLYGVNGDIYAFGSRRLWYSSNTGTTWRTIFEPADTVYAMRRMGDELIVYTIEGWKFVRAGVVTGEMTAPVQLKDSRVFIFDASESVIAILTEAALYVSNDRGKTWGSLKMSRESMFPYVRVSNDRVFSPLPGMGLMMFDVYSNRPQPQPTP